MFRLPTLQPIVYALILNVLVLVFAAAIAWHMNNAVVFICGVLMLTHITERFADSPAQARPEDDPDYDPLDDPNREPGMGFTARL